MSENLKSNKKKEKYFEEKNKLREEIWLKGKIYL